MQKTVFPSTFNFIRQEEILIKVAGAGAGQTQSALQGADIGTLPKGAGAGAGAG